MHSLSANYNTVRTQPQPVRAGRPRGGLTGAHTGGPRAGWVLRGNSQRPTRFEAWADVARHYRVDPGWTAVSGYSMGGFARSRLLATLARTCSRAAMSTVWHPGTAAPRQDRLASQHADHGLEPWPPTTWCGSTRASRTSGISPPRACGSSTILFPAAEPPDARDQRRVRPPPQPSWATTAWTAIPRHVTYVVDPTEDSSTAAAVGEPRLLALGLAVRDPKDGEHRNFRRALRGASAWGIPRCSAVQPGGGNAERRQTTGRWRTWSAARDWGPPAEGAGARTCSTSTRTHVRTRDRRRRPGPG